MRKVTRNERRWKNVDQEANGLSLDIRGIMITPSFIIDLSTWNSTELREILISFSITIFHPSTDGTFWKKIRIKFFPKKLFYSTTDQNITESLPVWWEFLTEKVAWNRLSSFLSIEVYFIIEFLVFEKSLPVIKSYSFLGLFWQISCLLLPIR